MGAAGDYIEIQTAQPEIIHMSRDVVDQQRRASELQPGRWPSMIIARRFNNRSVEALAWQAHLDDFQRLNSDKGRVIGTTAMACVYIPDPPLTRMFEDRYGQAFQDRRQALELQRKFARELSAHIRLFADQAARADFELQSGPLLLTEGTVSVDHGMFIHEPIPRAETVPDHDYGLGSLEVLDDTDDSIALPEDPVAGVLQPGLFSYAAAGARKLGADNRLGLDLVGNEMFFTEMDIIKDFMKSKGFDLGLLCEPGEKRTPTFRPTIDFFETFESAGRQDVGYMVERPSRVPLHPPAAYAPPQ